MTIILLLIGSHHRLCRGMDPRLSAREAAMRDSCGLHSRDERNTWELHDGHGIYLCRVCPKCVKTKLGRYRPDIMENYVSDEPREEE